MDELRRRRVVLLDDEPAILRAWRAILEVHDLEAVCCETAEEALSAVAAGCDCFITDYHMSDMTGVEVLEAARELAAEVPMLLMTADDTPAIRAAALAAGATDVIGKPAPILKVVARIEELCGNQ
jgi:DNA-binding response OmpR family regulator